MTSRVKIRLVNSNGLLALTSNDGQGLTEYKFDINDASSVGLFSSDATKIEQRIRDIVLAMNLTQRNVALTTKGSIFPAAVVNNIGGITETNRVVAGIEIDIDEQTTLANITLLDKLNRHSHIQINQGKRHNLVKALDEYEAGLDSIEMKSMFKHLFNALENAVNWDKDRTGSDLDQEIAKISGESQHDIGNWHLIYNRLKHPDTSLKKRQDYSSLQNDFMGQLMSLRDCTNRVLIAILLKFRRELDPAFLDRSSTRF